MYTCIGKRRGPRGETFKCTNTSETPTNPDKPAWGYLCPDCANSPTKILRPQLNVELIDVDKPNYSEEIENGEVDYTAPQELTEREALADLEEIELLGRN